MSEHWTVLAWTAVGIVVLFGLVSWAVRKVADSTWPSPTAMRFRLARRPLREGAGIALAGTAAMLIVPLPLAWVVVLVIGAGMLVVVLRFQREAARYPDRDRGPR